MLYLYIFVTSPQIKVSIYLCSPPMTQSFNPIEIRFLRKKICFTYVYIGHIYNTMEIQIMPTEVLEKCKRSNSATIWQYKFLIFTVSFNLDKNLSKIILLFSNACNMERNPTLRGNEIRLGND